ncbi:phage head closure protein [Bacillus sp. Hm123]|uniref:phage head closure protein n=1 Tax=Bacillus sp. Hm123 TaxID=3450745 RepID=UPI003F42E14F
MNKRLRNTLNDGVLLYGRNTTLRSNTGKKIGTTFKQEGKLHYKEMTHREQDYRLVDALGSTLDLKVKTLYPPSFKYVQKTDLIIRIGDLQFEAARVDPDETRAYLYFYLQKVGETSEIES